MTQNSKLLICDNVKLNDARMLIGFSGWMDGGEVSTGTVKYLIEKLGANKIAELDSEGFYINNFPGPMEITALFRPHTKIKDGIIKTLEMTKNEFFCCEKNNLILFLGKEPNLHWRQFADHVFSLCEKFNVKMIYFIGSVAGLVPHTREPRILCTVSNEKLKEPLDHYGVKFANYEGPASFITYLNTTCDQHNLNMASLVATMPAYVQGNNPKCIEAVIKRLSAILKLHIEFDSLKGISDEFEKRLTELVQQEDELAENIQKLEENYDNEIFDNEMGDLKKWLEQKGVRLD